MNRFEKWSVLGSALATLLTGVAYLWVKYWMQPADPWAAVNHPLQPWLLKAHILVAPLLVFAVGTIATRHVWRHFRSGIRWGRRSGLSTALALAPMVLTGYLIQAVTHPGWLQAMSLSHIGFGLLFAVGLGVHYAIVRRRPRRSSVRHTHRVRIPQERTHRFHRQGQGQGR